MNICNKLKQTSTNNVLPMEINIVFGINTNSSSAGRRESTDLDILSDFTPSPPQKIFFLILEIASELATWNSKRS